MRAASHPPETGADGILIGSENERDARSSASLAKVSHQSDYRNLIRLSYHKSQPKSQASLLPLRARSTERRASASATLRAERASNFSQPTTHHWYTISTTTTRQLRLTQAIAQRSIRQRDGLDRKHRFPTKPGFRIQARI